MKTLKLLSCLLLAMFAPRFASALIVGPYTADANTLHLFHLNETSGSVTVDSVTGGNAYTVQNATSGNGTATPPTVTTILNAAAYSGFGTAANLNTAGYIIGYDANANGQYDADVATGQTGDTITLSSFFNMGNGSQTPWTIEAMIYPSVTNAGQEILCTDSYHTRGFQFKINSAGQLELNFITGATGTTDIKTGIPNSGFNAFVANTWYHVAATYDGSNVRLYWTKVDPSVAAANLISTTAVGVGTAVGAVTAPFDIGNENRGASAEYFQGRIDEVRVSKVARVADQMMFAPATISISQQPYSQEGVDYNGSGSLSVSAASALPISYQWRLNNTPISGATNASYSFTSATAANAGNYDCVLTNSNPSSITSAVCVVSIGAPNFLAHRYGFTDDYSDSIGGATGTNFGNATITSGSLVLDGTTDTYLQLPAGLVTNQAAITIETWASFGTVANNSMLFAFGNTNGNTGYNYIFGTPHGSTARIAITPAYYTSEQMAVAGTALDNYSGVQVVAVFAPAAGYEALYTNGVLAAINTNVTVQLSSVSNYFTFIGKSLYSGDPYLAASIDEFRIYNGALSAASIQQSYLQGADNALSTGPVAILVSPTNTTVAVSQPVTFSGLASGLPTISYQWFKNSVLIPGATNRTYTYNAPYSDNNATFVLMATNVVSSTTYTATSDSATLTVLLPETLAWLGENGNGWNLTDYNWTNATSLVPYAQFDRAVFDDRGAAQPAVDLQFAVAPIALTVSNTTADYVFYSASDNGSLDVLGTLLKQGSGKLTLAVSNVSAGPTVVQNGTLQIGNWDATGSLGSGPVTNNATLQFNRTDGISVANDLHGSGTFVVNSGTLTPASTNNDFTGGVVINGGIIYAINTNALGSTVGGTTVNSGAQLYIIGNVNFGAEALSLAGSGGDGNGALRKGGAGATAYSGALTLTDDSTIGVDGGATITLNSPLGISGAFALTKNGGGTLALNATNSYSGGTVLSAGVINVNTNGALGTGPVTATTSGRFVIADGLNITNSFTASAVNPGVATGFIMVNNNTIGTVTTVSGPVQMESAATGGNFYGPISSGYLNIVGPVTMPDGTFMVIRDGRLRFSGGGSYPEIQVRASTTSLGANNGVATSAVLDLAGNGTAFFDLNGFNQTLAGVKNTVTPANAGIGFVTNSSGTAATLTLDLGTGNTYSSGSKLTGNLSLVLNSGTQVFTEANSYTGNTIVNGGTLELAVASLAANSTITVASGAKLQLDFTETNRVAGLVLNGASQAPGVYNNSTSPTYITGSGSLLVQAGPSGPGYLTNSVSGSTLSLSWPAGQGWRLQMQTNSLSVGLSTNWVYVTDGTVSSTNITINPAQPTAFYRLVYP